MQNKFNMEKIKEFVRQKHDNQKRRQGTPYYLHPFAVADKLKEKGYGEDYQIAALFHDLLEDTDVTTSELLSLSNDEIVFSVRLLTKENGYNMEEYINGIQNNEIAKMVKLADRLHNLEESNMADEYFIKKYVDETNEWYIDLSKGTCFEKEIKEVTDKLEKMIIY